MPTFREAAKIVHESHRSSWRNAKHRAQWINTLKSYVFPCLGNLSVNSITSAEVVEALSPIWVKKPETARRVRQRIGTVLDWAKARRCYRDADNPVRAVLRALPKPPRSKKHHSSLPYRELPDFLQKLRTGEANVSTRLALEFLILTATRTNEVLGATWAEIDLSQKVWTIPADRMKAKREFRVPLSKKAIQILTQAQTLGNSQDPVFPGQQNGKPLSQIALLMLLRRMKWDVTTHGFRSKFRRANFTVKHSWANNFSATLRGNWYGDYKFANPSLSPVQDMSGDVYWDIDVTWDASDAIRVTLGGSNILDAAPDPQPSFFSCCGITAHQSSVMGWQGPYYYIRGIFNWN